MDSTYIETTVADPLLPDLRRLRDRRICVMGGCGQVGSHIVTKLYEVGIPVEQVFINDDLSLGKTANLPAAFRGDVDTRSHLEYAGDPPTRPDIVIFVGGRSSAPHFTDLGDVLDEITTWRQIVAWCVRERIRLIFASTSSLCKSRPSRESEPVWAGSLYELTKQMMENVAIQQALGAGLVSQICRFFSVYGITEQHKGNFGNLYTQLIWHAREGKEFDLWGQEGVFGAGEQTRDTIFAVDVARAVLYLLTLPEPQPTLDDTSSMLYNIGQGNPVSINEMIDEIREGLQLTPRIRRVEVPDHVTNYVVHTWGDPGRLMAAGYQPLFADHRRNLALIAGALSDMDGYWRMVDEARERIGARG